MSSSSMSRVLKNLKKQDFLITSRLDLWLVRNPELVLTADDLNLIDRLMKPRGTRVGTFTGSQAGTCERYQMFNYIGLPQLGKVDPILINRFMDGTWRHVRWQIILPKAIPGLEVEVRVDSPMFRGAFDGVHFDERWGMEIKGTRMFGRMIREGVFDAHQMQASRYWQAADEDPNLPELTKFSFFYEDKVSNNYREIVVKRDAQLDRFVQAELRRLRDAATNYELPPVIPECVRGRGEIFNECPYSDRCLTISNWTDAERSSGTNVDKPKLRTTKSGVRRTVRKVTPRTSG